MTTNSKSPAFLTAAVIAVVVLLAIITTAAAFIYRHSTHKSANQSAQNSQPQQQPGVEVPHHFKHEVVVDITAATIMPETLTIPKETEITWLNKDSVSHKLNFTPGTTVPAQFDFKYTLEAGGGYGYIMYNPGTYHYYVVEKPTENGTIIVQ